MHHFVRLVAPKLCPNNKFARLVAPPVKKSLRKIASGASNFSSFRKVKIKSLFFRKILPKGTSFDNLTQEDIDLVVSHVNSLSRQSLNGKSSYEVFSLIYGTEVLDQLNVKKIAANDVILIPELLSNK